MKKPAKVDLAYVERRCRSHLERQKHVTRYVLFRGSADGTRWYVDFWLSDPERADAVFDGKLTTKKADTWLVLVSSKGEEPGDHPYIRKVAAP